MGPKTEKYLNPKGLKREARNCQQRGVKTAQHPRGTIWMKKVRNIRWHTFLIDTLKTETSNFLLNPSLHWKPVECSEQCCCICMPGLTEDKSSYMILYVLMLIQFVVRDTSKKRIAVSNLERMRETASLLAASVDRKKRIFPIRRSWQNKMRHEYLICACMDSSTIFQTTGKNWKVRRNTWFVKLGIICKEMMWKTRLTNYST